MTSGGLTFIVFWRLRTMHKLTFASLCVIAIIYITLPQSQSFRLGQTCSMIDTVVSLNFRAKMYRSILIFLHCANNLFSNFSVMSPMNVVYPIFVAQLQPNVAHLQVKSALVKMPKDVVPKIVMTMGCAREIFEMISDIWKKRPKINQL